MLARNRGHRGHRPFRRALGIYRPSSFTRSGLERHFRELIERAGLPAPRSNFVEEGFELDLYWPIVRITGSRVDREPEQVIRRLGLLLAQRRRQLGRGAT